MKPTALLPALLLLHAATPAAAGEPGVDVEIDPIAYALDGYSLHAGITHERLRVDLGAFALAVPAAVHGNDGFSASGDGFGAKLQYFALEPGARLFVGGSLNLMRLWVERDGTQLAERARDVTVGVQVGWRFTLPHDFYASPWIGLDYTVTGADDVVLDGATYERSPWTVFPTVHLGRRFD